MHNAPMSQKAQPIHISGSTLFVRSYAKINLTLDVLGRRADGYHELATVMQTIDLYDTICLTVTDEPGVRVVSTTSTATTTGLCWRRRHCASDSNFRRGLALNSINAFLWPLAWAEEAATPPLYCWHYSNGGS